jgi:phosphoserine phosphatase RsbU/P
MENEKRYILLVDDEQSILNSLSRELRRWAGDKGIEILTANGAKMGLDILSEKGLDTVIVVSDLKMPEMKGSDFLQAVKNQYPGIVTILLTGYSEADEIVKAVRAGIFSYMLKPWDSDYLVAEMEKAFEQGELKRQNARYLKMMEEELKWAGEMQKAILKPSLPHAAGVAFSSMYRPVSALYCGGDYYDVISLSPDRYLILVGDVAGHGVRAAFITGILKAVIYPEYVRSADKKSFSPGAFLGWLNERMNFELRQTSGLIVTFLAGVLDLKARSFSYANAGQNHPILVREGKTVELLISGPGLGFMDSMEYVEESLGILGGDAITAYTDGLTEPDPSNGKPSVEPIKLFDGVPYGPNYHDRLLKSALEISRSADFSDDVTIVTASVD